MRYSTSPPQETKKLLYILIPFVLTLGMALDIYLPSIPRISDSLSTSIEMVQWTMSGFFLCFGIGQLFIGPISDHLGRKKTIFASLALYVIGSITSATSQTIEFLIFSRGIQALGSCGTQITAFSIVKDSIKDRATSEQIFTYLKGSMGFAPIAAPIIGSFIDYHFSWRISFYFLSLFGLILIIMNYLWLKESLHHKDRTKISRNVIRNYFQMLQNKTFISLTLCVIGSQSVLFSFFSLSPHIIITKFGYSTAFFGYCFALNAFTYTIASWISGKIIVKIGTYRCILIGSTMMLLGGTTILSAHLLGHFNLIAVMVSSLISSSGVSFILGPATSLAVDQYKKTTGSATALIGSLEAISAAFIGNFAIKFSHYNGLTFASIVLTAGIFSTLVGLKYKKSNTGSENN